MQFAYTLTTKLKLMHASLINLLIQKYISENVHRVTAMGKSDPNLSGFRPLPYIGRVFMTLFTVKTLNFMRCTDI